MYPELWHLPIINYPVRSYGFMLMIGFLSAIYLAARRAEKSRVNPDVIINLGFCALFGGVVGARLFYVIHYWEREFSGHGNPIWAMVDISKGGMEFYGGLVGSFVLILGYILIMRESFRLLMDVITPAAMWGLAFGRMGCFLNGCCWGGMCGGTIAENWAVQFPYGSPSYFRQYQNRQVKVPQQLLLVNKLGQARPYFRHEINIPSVDKWNFYQRKLNDTMLEFDIVANVTPDSTKVDLLKKRIELLQKKAKEEKAKQAQIQRILDKYPSVNFPDQKMTLSELTDLVKNNRTLPVHPVQIYGIINALLGALFLEIFFRVRKHHGLVFAVFLMTYPWTRIVLELIRVDNPKDTFGLTVSQALSIALIISGIVTFYLCRKMPLISPAAKPWNPPPEEKLEKK